MVDLGFLIVYAGFAGALGATWIAAQRLSRARSRRDLATIAAAGAAIVCVGCFWLPAISGFARGTINGWQGLDPLSSGASVLVAVTLTLYAALPAAGGDLRATLVLVLGASIAALVAGNALIQTYTERGTDAEWGLYTAAAAGVLSALASAVGAARARRRGHSGW